MTGIDDARLTADFWIARLDQADRVVLDPARIGVFVDDWRIAPLTQASAA